MGIDRQSAIQALFKKGFTLSGTTYSKHPKKTPRTDPRKNTHDHKDSPEGEIPNPKPKRHKKAALDTAAQGAKEGIQRVTVIFTGHRVRPLDPDNFAGGQKSLLDGLRHCGLIEGDEPWRIRLVTDQVKVAHFKDEYTLIEIEYPENN